MTDIRRTVLWVVFSASLFLLWNAWSVHNGQPSFFNPGARSAATVVTQPPVASGVAPSVGAAGFATVTPAAPAAQAAPPPVAEQVTIRTDVIEAKLSSEGGTLSRVELLKYPEHVERDLWQQVGHIGEQLSSLFSSEAKPSAEAPKPVVLLDESPGRYYVAETGLIPTVGSAGLPNQYTAMTLMPGERTLTAGRDALQVRFESPVVGGLKVVKTYTFKRGDYVVDVKNEVVNDSATPIAPSLYVQLVRDGIPPPGGSSVYSTFTGPAVYTDTSKFKKVDFKSIEKREPGDKPPYPDTADNGWVAMVQHYFASAWLIDKADGAKQSREYFTRKLEVTNPATGALAHVYSVGMLMPLGTVEPGAAKTFDARLFVGPQEERRLGSLAPGLELVKDYGIFKILAEPLFWLLTQLHKILGNWGWSIVGLVVLLKIAFFWLNATAYRSMAKMKAINPRIMEMRERLKDKPQQMQQEMMRIYREEKVNPLGGCLPIVAQMPFFISLYWVLLSTVEMRGAPWIGWITDLSAKDPYFILPLLMTATSLLQTWLNPTPPDPVQAKMMWIMPLVFSVMFFVFPSGLVLYWLTNNILSIAQQYLINKKLGVLNK
ncbi:MAG: membrane protein insertase YidC [Pseudomonadota bacterium]|nr:membrane protein insertase YidC [Pseudomonadota bacterium]